MVLQISVQNYSGQNTEMDQKSVEDELTCQDQMKRRAILNVGGTIYTTFLETLLVHPNTRLGKLATSIQNGEQDTEYFFDRDARVFENIIQFYRVRHLHKQHSIHPVVFQQELEYWGIDDNQIGKCCEDFVGDQKMEDQFKWFEPTPLEILNENACCEWRRHLWLILTSPSAPQKYPKLSKLMAAIYLLVTLIQIFAIAFGTVPEILVDIATLENSINSSTPTPVGERFLRQRMQTTFEPLSIAVIRNVCSLYFALEYILRTVCCPGVSYLLKPIQIFDNIIVTVEITNIFLFSLWNNGMVSLQTMLTFNQYTVIVTQARVFRLLGYCRHYSGLQVLMLTLYKSTKEILLLIILMYIIVLMMGPLIFLCEAGHGNVTDTITGYWWTLVTLTTVGYGDYYPVTKVGHLIACVIMLSGMIMTALPIAVIGANFSIYHEYNEQRMVRLERRKNRVEKRNTSRNCY